MSHIDGPCDTPLTTFVFPQLTEPILLDPDNETVLLPIFPLRKHVRLPTDELTLNLYEERYLAMSEFMLSQLSSTIFNVQSRKSGFSNVVPFFGAVYCSDKHQIITQGGTAPVVPILQPGDVGVLCMVLTWTDGIIPTKCSSKEENGNDETVEDDRTDTETWRRRIRLNALAVGRFRIDRIIHDGTLVENKPPFILVEAILLKDDYSLKFDAAKLKRLDEELQRLLERSWRSRAKILPSTNELPAQVPLRIVDRICSMIRYGNSDSTGQRNELMSFLAAATVMKMSGSTSPKDMTNILRTQSLEARLNILSHCKRL
jgi:Lon protease-like protein